MKKFIVILAAAIAGTFAANAQEEKSFKPEAMDFALEVNYTPGTLDFGSLSGGNGTATVTGSFALPEYGVKGRLFITDRLAVKLNLGFSTVSDNRKEYITTGNSTSTTDNITSNTVFTIMPGAEYHFGNFSRVSPYVGAGIGILAGSNGEKTIATDQTSVSTTPVFGLGINVSAGVDVYICKGLYAGVELQLGYEYSKTGLTQTTITIGTGSPTTSTDGPEYISNAFGFYAMPALRIGWFF